MKLGRLGILVVFAALVCISTSYSAVLLTAEYRGNARAFQNKLGLDPPGGKQEFAVGGVILEVEPGPFLFEGEARAEHGDCTAVMYPTARAEAGSIGVGLLGTTISTPGPHFGSAEVGGRVEARWLEFIVPRVRNKAVGQRFIFNTLLVLEGQLGANLSTGGEDFGGANAHAELEFYEDSSGSDSLVPPYFPHGFGQYWATLQASTNDHLNIVNPPPGAIHVRHEMFNGLSYTFDNKLILNGAAQSANGGTAFLTADFSSSLKWGGVESVTDEFGNPIPREDWTIESESGFDYSRSFDEQVPEPSSILLLAAALCARLALGRRRRSTVRSE